MSKLRIHAILSDYDGTLVSLANVKNSETNTLPTELQQTLEKVSSEIPVCIISTKDFEFLKRKTAFARILSCMMGIETIVLGNKKYRRTIEKRLIHADLQVLQLKSRVLEAIADEITSEEEFSYVVVERKHISDDILAGLTLDWRHLGDWSYYRRGINHFTSRLVSDLKKPPVPVDIFVQKYSQHPFFDIYSADCNKGMAFDIVVSELAKESIDGKDTLYLGDSENDNPAFRKAGISVGIRSDARVSPKLDCSYVLDYEQLSSFLMKLRQNDFLFTDELLMESQT
jgi:HAD superfamily hydrolase (TIGR01484 family)